jgi:hypothetical protein
LSSIAVSERKLRIFSKIKSKIPDFERGNAKIITIPFKYSGTGIHTLKYFGVLSAAGYNLSLLTNPAHRGRRY